MDRIKELSLDQKAKLYYMGLVRKGEIDRLPEDPKAAFVKDMMGRKDELKGIATELGYLNEEKNCGCGKNPCETYGTINEGKVDISYTDPGFRFYKMKVDGKRLDREEGTKYLKGLGIDMEIPRSYNETILDKIVSQLKEKGIDADHDAAMDVS